MRKGYYRDPGGNRVALMRSFVKFDGEGEAVGGETAEAALEEGPVVVHGGFSVRLTSSTHPH